MFEITRSSIRPLRAPARPRPPSALAALAAALAVGAALIAGCGNGVEPPWDDHVNVRVDNLASEDVVIWAYEHTSEITPPGKLQKLRSFRVIPAFARDYVYFSYDYDHERAFARGTESGRILGHVKIEDNLHWTIYPGL